LDDRRRDGGTISTLRTKEQGTHVTLNEHDDDDDDDDDDDEVNSFQGRSVTTKKRCILTYIHTRRCKICKSYNHVEDVAADVNKSI